MDRPRRSKGASEAPSHQHLMTLRRKSLTPYIIALSAISLPIVVPAIILILCLLEHFLFGTHYLESLGPVRSVLRAIGIDE